jgi:hypothetical protein
MKNTDLKSNREDLAIKNFFDFDLAQESDQSMLDKEEELQRLVDEKKPLELLDILRLTIRSNALRLVSFLVEEKGITPDTDTLLYALGNAEISAEFLKLDKKYSIKILKYLMKKVQYINADLDSPQEKLALQEKQEDFIQALSESRYININDSICGKDKLNVEFSEYRKLEEEMWEKIEACKGFNKENNLTIYDVVRNRIIMSAYLERYFQISKCKKEISDLLSSIGGKLPSIELTILQFSDVYISRKKYPKVLAYNYNLFSAGNIKVTTRNLKFPIGNAKVFETLLGCKDENGQMIMGSKAQDKEWCVNLFKQMRNENLEGVAQLLDYKGLIHNEVPKDIYQRLIYDTLEDVDNDTSKKYSLSIADNFTLFIREFIKEQLLLAKTASAKTSQIDKKEEVGASLKPDLTPSVSSLVEGKSLYHTLLSSKGMPLN